MNTLELSQDLQKGRDPALRRRRAVVCLSLGAAATMGLLGAYQVGLINRLPEPRLKWLNSAKVVGSGQAYRHLRTPDALLGLGSYAVTAILAAAGGKERPRTRPWLSLAMAGKVLADALNALRMTWNEALREKALCLYCLLATALTLGMVPLVVPEARQALGQLLHRPFGRGAAQQSRQEIARVARPVVYPWSKLRHATTAAR